MLRIACSVPPVKKIVQQKLTVKNPSLQKRVFGLTFKNPVGLGAGFDKNAKHLNEMEALGFGFVEIGTVTPKAQPGNDKPRCFRLPEDKALINRMGFNNDGVDIIKERLIKWNNAKHKTNGLRMIIGGNIGKNKYTPNVDAWLDYEICFKELFDVVDYFVVNVSSPNTPNLRELHERNALNKILSDLQNINFSKNKPKPLLLKIAPDLTQQQLDDIISLSLEIKLSGLVATNTTVERDKIKTQNLKIKNQTGGLSGKPLAARSTEVIQYLSSQLNNQIPIIASGGIFTGNDAKEKLNAGASLIQVWTGFIYQGPTIVKDICKELAK
jgi:dihydroorotate dehydrogenase